MPIYPSPHGTIDIPQVDIYTAIFEQKNKPFPDDHVIFVDGDTKRKVTFSELKKNVARFGEGLKAMWNWKKGDVLCLFSPNQIDSPSVTWGTHWAGGVVTPANPTYTAKELAFQLKDSNSKALITIAALLPIATQAAAEVGLPKERILLIGDQKVIGYQHWSQMYNLTATIHYRRTKVNPKKDLAFIAYSSGTTGVPKGVMLSHSNVVTNMFQFIAVEDGLARWDRDRIIAFLPFFHIYGLTCIMHYACYLGVETLVMSRFDLEKYLSLLQEHKITYAFVVPPVLLLMAKHPLVDKFNLSSLRVVSCGAAPLTKDLIEEFYARLKVPVKQGYGLSETAPVTHGMQVSYWEQHKGACGKLLPNMEIKFVSESGEELKRGQTGEIWVRGDNVMLGYLNNPEATKNCITEDGFFKTGDIGHETEDGVLYITDRLKELIKYKGFQVPPAELEGTLLGHPSIADVAVIGVFSPEQATEVPRAYVVLKEGVEANEAKAKEIEEWLKSRVAAHKRLRGGVRFRKDIPKSVSGKILRRFLRDEAKKEEEEAGKSAKAKL